MYITNEVIKSFIAANSSLVRKSLALYGIHENIPLLVFDGSNLWGYYDPNQKIIAINKEIIHQSNQTFIRELILHEVAHCIVDKIYPDAKSHGVEFNEICIRIGGNPLAKGSLNKTLKSPDFDPKEGIIIKIQKLLKLGESSNEHEAQLALEKANNLLLKHNLNISHDKEVTDLYFKRVFFFKRLNQKARTIAQICQTFGVYTIFNRISNNLEVSGSKVNVQIADYVANFLNTELDHLWKKTKKTHNLKGVRAKNSFYYGVLLGYKDKVTPKQEESTSKDNSPKTFSTELEKINDHIRQMANSLLYSNVSKSTPSNSIDEDSFKHGKKAGKSMTINKSIRSKSRKLLLN